MISRLEYNKALDIVEAYHKQLFIGGSKHSLSWNDLTIGSKIVFSKTMSKHLTEGKEYEVCWVDENWKVDNKSWFSIIDDNNKHKSLRKQAKGYLMSAVYNYS
jgi:hypothetical protein